MIRLVGLALAFGAGCAFSAACIRGVRPRSSAMLLSCPRDRSPRITSSSPCTHAAISIVAPYSPGSRYPGDIYRGGVRES